MDKYILIKYIAIELQFVKKEIAVIRFSRLLLI